VRRWFSTRKPPAAIGGSYQAQGEVNYMLNNLMAYLTVTFLNVKDGEDGQTLVEYALILALVSILSIAALLALSGKINTVFTNITNTL
jgi:Flp pilus assembly pilin Flp